MNSRLILRFAGLAAIASLSTTLAVAAEPQGMPALPQMSVFKHPNCGCCKAWVEYVRKHAFTVTAKDTSDPTATTQASRAPADPRCRHTAFVNRSVSEGHVPIEDIKRLLAEKPEIEGLAVGGLPIGSPGMEVGNRKEAYDVVAFTRDGTTRVFAKH